MDVFTAIADPTRRSVLDELAKGPRPAGEIVAAFPNLTQPAVSRHLRILREVGLVKMEPQAQKRIYSLNADAMAELYQWIAKYSAFWPKRLDALEKHLDDHHGKNRNEE